MKKRKVKWGWIITAVVVVLAGTLLFFRAQRAVEEAVADFQTEEIAKGNLTATIGATGTVDAKQTALVMWETNGAVEDVLVSVGDAVDKDAVMASLALDSMNQSVILAEADLLVANNALDDLYDAYSDLAISQKQQEIAALEDQLVDLQYEKQICSWRRINWIRRRKILSLMKTRRILC
jgi:HlyD family secretion protein